MHSYTDAGPLAFVTELDRVPRFDQATLIEAACVVAHSYTGANPLGGFSELDRVARASRDRNRDAGPLADSTALDRVTF